MSTRRIRLAVLAAVVAVPVLGWQGRALAAGDAVEYLIDKLMYDSDDDQREDAAKALGRIGNARALPALEQAAVYDEEDDVRDEARKAIRRIRSLHPTVVVAQTPAPVVPPAPQQVPATAPAVQAPAPAVVAPTPVVTAPPVLAAPVYVAPPPVVVAPAPIYVAPPPVLYHRVVVRHFHPAPVYAYPAPVRHVGFHFGFHHRH